MPVLRHIGLCVRKVTNYFRNISLLVYVKYKFLPLGYTLR